MNEKDFEKIEEIANTCNGDFEIDIDDTELNIITVEFSLLYNEDDENIETPYFNSFHELIDEEGYKTERDNCKEYKLHITKGECI